MKRGHHIVLFTLLALVASFVFMGDAMAANPSGEFTGLLDLVKQNSDNWFAALLGYAKTVFFMLAFIQLVWTFFPLVFKQADLGEIVGELIRFVVTIGFFYFLLTQSKEVAESIVNSLWIAGGKATGTGANLTPGGIFDVAVNFAQTIGAVETWNPLTAMMIALAGLVVLLCFAFIAAFMGLTIIESYIVINASVIFMGFGGSSWTRDYAIAMLRYAVAVGAKLFVLTLLVGLVITSAQQWQAAYNNTDQASMWTMIGLALACAYFCKTLPELVAGLITGVSPGGGATIGMMAGAAAAGAAAAAGVVATVATAGAAAPAAVGATGAAASSTGVAGAGGLGASLSTSMAGGSAAASSAGAGATGAAGAGTGAASTGATGANAAGPGKGVGGLIGGAEKAGGNVAAKTGGKAAEGAAPSSTGSGNASGVAKAAGKVANAAPGGGDDKAQQQPAAAPTPAGQGQRADTATAGASEAKSDNKGGSGLHTALSAGTRAMGVMAAISVPGMESSAGLSLGSPPPSAGSSGGESQGASEGDMAPDEGNVIRGAEPAQATADTSNASNAPGESSVIDTSGDVAAAKRDRDTSNIASLIVPGMTPRGEA